MFNIVTVSHGGEIFSIAGKREIVVDSLDDLDDIPKDTAPGSVAYTADLKNIWTKGNDGNWVKAGD